MPDVWYIFLHPRECRCLAFVRFSRWIPSAERLSVALNSPKDKFNTFATKQSASRYPMLDDDKENPSAEDTRLDSDSISRDGSWLSIASIGFRGRNKGGGKGMIRKDQRISLAKAYFITDSPNWNRKWSLLSGVIIDHFDLWLRRSVMIRCIRNTTKPNCGLSSKRARLVPFTRPSVYIRSIARSNLRFGICIVVRFASEKK